MTDDISYIAGRVPDYVTEGMEFDTHARLEIGPDGERHYVAFVYLDVEVIAKIVRPVSEFPDGIRDFATWSQRKVARRLGELLAIDDPAPSDGPGPWRQP